MYVDSHCHLDFPELRDDLAGVLAAMRGNGVTHALCVAVEEDRWPAVRALAHEHDNLYATVGVHPDQEAIAEASVATLVAGARDPRVVAIGETGLDYFRRQGDLEWQRQRFRTHIRAAREAGLPLVIHTRAAAADTLAIMRDERAGEVGGVMHCFTESWEVAEQAMELGFYISFSGIVTFRNAGEIRETAMRVPLERMLIETDSPYLTPVPWRGKRNQPAFVRHVGEEIARLRGMAAEMVAAATSRNFFALFRVSPDALAQSGTR